MVPGQEPCPLQTGTEREQAHGSPHTLREGTEALQVTSQGGRPENATLSLLVGTLEADSAESQVL